MPLSPSVFEKLDLPQTFCSLSLGFVNTAKPFAGFMGEDGVAVADLFDHRNILAPFFGSSRIRPTGSFAKM